VTSLSPRFALALAAIAAAAGCGGRAEIWSATVPQGTAFGLTTAVAIVDAPANRVVLLKPGDGQSLSRTFVPVGHNVVASVVSPDLGKLLVLSAGHRATIGDAQPNEVPSLTVIEPGASSVSRRYDLAVLSSPLAGVAVDPVENRWVVLYAGSGGGASQAFVQNPNEIVLVDLTQPPETATPVDYTLHSVGGSPVRFDFTPPLNISGFGAPQRLLIVESSQDLAILRLDDPANSETSVPLTSSTDTRRLAPAAVAFDAGDPTVKDARIGVRVQNDSTVLTFDLAADSPRSGLAITPNLADVGGIPSDIAFVHPGANNLRLAALVPSIGKAVLVDPLTSLTTPVALPAAYQTLSLVPSTTTAAAGAGPDTALLWNGLNPQDGAAFWDLGAAVNKPYSSIQTIGLETTIADVIDVPTGPHNDGMLKVLETRSASAFYVLDLGTRTAAPLITSTSSIDVSVSHLGDYVWTFVPGGTEVAATDFTMMHPHPLLIERPVSAVFEVARGPGLDPAAIVLHEVGGLGATVYDAATLDDQTRRLYSGLLLGGSTP
jgi:hypothetical protein